MQQIFVLASPRSGTTMLGAMLGAHTSAVALPESPFIGGLYYEYFSSAETTEAKAIADRIAKNYRFMHWSVDFLPHDFLKNPQIDRSQYRVFIDDLVSAYAKKEGKNDIATWIEHSPSNTRVVISLAEAFPDARFIHLIRDGRANALSVIPLDWGGNDVYEAAHFWLEDLSYGFAAELSLGQQRCIRIRYEDLVCDADTTLRRICAFSELEFEPDMIAGAGFNLPDYTSAQHKLVGTPPDATRVVAWQTGLTSRQIKIFENIAGSMLKHLGYELFCSPEQTHVIFSERLRSWLVCYLRREVVDRVRAKRRQEK